MQTNISKYGLCSHSFVLFCVVPFGVRTVRAFVVFSFLFFLTAHSLWAEDDIHGSAHLTYISRDTETDGQKENDWQFTQVYNMGVRKAFTPKLGFSADLDVNVTESNEAKTTRVAPDLRLDVNNEYFDANTGYRLNERGLDVLTMVSDETRRTTESWNANMSTKSEKYPKIRLRYNQDRDYDHLAVRETDTKTNDFSGSADYAFRFFDFYYEYRNNQSDDYVDESFQETDIHEGRVSFRRSFLDNRLTASASYSITDRDTETRTGGQDVDVDEIQRADGGLWVRDNRVIPDPTAIQLDPKADLVDGNKTTSTTIDIGVTANENRQNIGVEFNAPKDVEKIYLYTEEPGNSFDATQFTWAVYHADNNTGNAGEWTQITASATVVYDDDENRFEIAFTQTRARYFKVVNAQNDGNSLMVTEIEAYDVTTFAAFTTTKDERTLETYQANLGYKPLDWLSFTYDFTKDDQDKKTDGEKTRRETHNVSGRVERDLHKYLSAWAQYRRRWAFDTETDDTTTDTLLVHFLSSPLDTLNTDLSFNHTVSKEESETQSRTSSALLQVTAKLREGADLDVDGNIVRTKNLMSDTKTTTRSIDSNLRLALTKMLTAELEYNRDWTETEQPSGETDEETSFGKTTLYWRPSHEFYLRGSYGFVRDEKTGDETTQQQYNLNWLVTEKMQLDMGYTLDKNDTDTQSYTSNLSWNLSRVLTLRFGYDWSRQEAETITKTQTFTTDLSARF